MGRKLVLAGTKLTNLAAPKLAAIDTILPDAGALLLLDPANPVNPWPTFDLNSTSGSVVLPNLAFDQAKALIPAGTATSLGVSYIKNANFENDGVKSKVERSSKGGLHVTYSNTQSPEGTLNRTVNLFAGPDLNAYLMANKAHSFYFAYWGKITRGNPSQGTGGAQWHAGGNSSNNIFNFYQRASSGETQYPTTANRLAHFGENVLATAGKTNLNIFQDIAVSDINAASSATWTPFRASPVGTTAVDQNRTASLLFYGQYAEDLTVSGRTYAQVNALVKAKYEKDVKNAGGRYYGDTYTAPLA